MKQPANAELLMQIWIYYNSFNTFGLGKKVNIEDTMIKHNLLNLEQMTVKALAIFMFTQNAGLNPPAFNNLFFTNSSKYNMRSKTQIIPRSYIPLN